MVWLVLTWMACSPPTVQSCDAGACDGTDSDVDTDSCQAGTDPDDCGWEPDTDTDTDTEWDTEPLPEGTDIDIDTEVCTPSGLPEQTELAPGPDDDPYRDWCVRPQTVCRTASQLHLRSTERCIQSSRVTGCAAVTMTVQWYGYDEYRDFFDGDGVLIGSQWSSDTNLDCPTDALPDASAFEVWTGQRITGCTVVETAYSAPCVPERAVAWAWSGGNARPPVGPSTLQAARQSYETGCYGEASCGEGRGTVVIPPAFDDGDWEERFEYWYYGPEGTLQASFSGFRVSGSTPGRCQGAVVQRLGSCGFIRP